MCIAPALLAMMFGHHKIEVTIGNDKETAQEIREFGQQIGEKLIKQSQ